MRIILSALIVFFAANAYGADLVKKLTLELDPVAPLAASTEENSSHGNSTSMWGANVEFNLGSRIATGPEIWIGAFKRKGNRETDTDGREQDYFTDEQFKIDSTRIRWMVGLYEYPSSIRGWFVKAGLSYMKTNSKGKTRNVRGHSLEDGTTPAKMESTIVDLRQGIVAELGQRWLMFDQNVSLALAASYTVNYARRVSVDSEDPNAREDYDNEIESIPGSKLSAEALPEAHLTVGYSF